MSVAITEKAAKEVLRVMADQGYKVGEDVLRVEVRSGGCSGFSYGLTFVKKEEVDALNDVMYEGNGIEWVVSNMVEPFIAGTVVDFQDSIDRRGFVFENPLATRGCGCGSSFNV